MESLTQRITRELFESHLEGAAEAMTNAENALLKAQVDLAAAIGQLTAAQQDSGPFIPEISLAPLNIARAHLEAARAQLATYTKVGQRSLSAPLIDLSTEGNKGNEDSPVENGANHFSASDAANDLSPRNVGPSGPLASSLPSFPSVEPSPENA